MTEPNRTAPPRPLHVLVANPSADVYGSDLQMLESIDAMIASGWSVTVASPDDGPLIAALDERSVAVLRVAFPVLRRENASAGGLLQLASQLVRALPRLWRTLGSEQPDVVYVNTVTIPWWLAVARLRGRPTMCHVHEAEGAESRAKGYVLYGPLLLAGLAMVNGRAAAAAVTAAVPPVRRRLRTVANGVAGPPDVPGAAAHGPGRRRLAVIGRLSPRKGTDIAIDAVAELRARGYDVELEVCGTAFAGYEPFVEQLERRATAEDLAGHVHFAGYVRPVWQVLERSEIVLAPSYGETLGNAVVEAQLGARAVVATDVDGHRETVVDGLSGVMVPPGDPAAMADAAAALLDDPARADELGATARRRALELYSIERYRSEVVGLLRGLAGG